MQFVVEAVIIFRQPKADMDLQRVWYGHKNRNTNELDKGFNSYSVAQYSSELVKGGCKFRWPVMPSVVYFTPALDN